jgi:hypothetical protein
MVRLLSLLLFTFLLAACATPDPYTTPITRDQAVTIARQKVEQEEHWGDKVDLMWAEHDKNGWHVWLSKYELGTKGEHMAPVDAWDRYILINDYGRILDYGGTF